MTKPTQHAKTRAAHAPAPSTPTPQAGGRWYRLADGRLTQTPPIEAAPATPHSAPTPAPSED